MTLLPGKKSLNICISHSVWARKASIFRTLQFSIIPKLEIHSHSFIFRANVKKECFMGLSLEGRIICINFNIIYEKQFTQSVKMLWLFVDCLTSQQHVSVSQERNCSDSLTCRHTEIEVADQTFHLTHR